MTREYLNLDIMMHEEKTHLVKNHQKVGNPKKVGKVASLNVCVHKPYRI